MSDIKILEQRAMEIRRKYDQLERQKNREPWGASKMARDFRKDASELVILLEEADRDSRKISHELGECLWRVLLIARKLDIDLERAFWTQMGNLEQAAEETKS
jgi:NTP pyrophosphatase (non-canonical NTP hydrolase)